MNRIQLVMTMNEILYPALAACTLLITIQLCVNIMLMDPEEINPALGILLIGSILAAYLLFTPHH